MRNILLSLALLTATGGKVQAQSARLGLKAGPSLTSFVGDVGRIDHKFGLHSGLLLNLGVNEAFSVQPELLYSQKGTRLDEDFFGTAVKYRRVLHYIDVPVLARYRSGSLFAEAGPQLGFLASARGEYDLNGPGSGSTDVTSAYHTIDFGYALGVGIQAKSGPLAGLRYNGGIANITKSSGRYQRNSAFQLYVGYLLPSR